MPKTINSFSGRYRFLSNFYRSPIEYEGIRYPTIEHFYQAQKSLSVEVRRQVAEQPTPGGVKRYGRTIYLRPGWESIKESIMLLGLRLKFTDTPLARLLLNTGETALIEGNDWGDTYWGVYRGEGLNRLGELLMQVRQELWDAEKTQQETVT